MIEAGGARGDSIQVGYIDPLKAKTGINVVRESPSSLGKLRALVESGQTGDDAVRARLGHRPAGQEARPDREARLGGDQSRADVPRGQERVRLRLPVLLDHHGVAQGREGAEELRRVLRHQGVPRQALPAGLSALLPAVRAAGGGRADRQAVPARRRPRLQEAERDQEGRRGVVEGRRPAAAAHEGQRGAVLRSAGRAASSAIRRSV